MTDLPATSAVFRSNGDGSETDFAPGFYFGRPGDLKVQVWNGTTKKWDLKTEGTHYDMVKNVVVFRSAHVPPVGDNNVEIFRNTGQPLEPTEEMVTSLRHNVIQKRNGQFDVADHPTETLAQTGTALAEVRDLIPLPPAYFTINGWFAAITTAHPLFGPWRTNAVHMPIVEPTQFEFVAVTLQHNDTGTPPSDWMLDLYTVHQTGGAGTKMAEFPVDFSGLAVLQNKTFQGTWKSPGTSTPIIVEADPNHMYYLEFGGGATAYVVGNVELSLARRTFADG